MKEINSQYRKCLEGAYQKQGKSLNEIEELLKNDKLAMEALARISGIEGIEIELCGSWVWITGNTKTVKDNLKEAKFLWARKKQAWYWRPPEEKGKTWRGGKMSLDEIRDKYGSSRMKNKRQALA